MVSPAIRADRSRQFDPRLESSRGVAALAVVICHAVAVLRVPDLALPLRDQPPGALITNVISAFLNPGAAVLTFFVLSGYVLTLSVGTGGISPAGLPTYLTKRAFRLLPPMWASVAVMALIRLLVPFTAVDGLSDFFLSNFGAAPTLRRIVGNLILAGYTINGVTWTMYVEVIGSLFVPISLMLQSRYGLRGSCGLAVLLAIVTMTVPTTLTLSYIFCFECGIVLASRPPRVASWARALLIAIALGIFAVDRLAAWAGGYHVVLLTGAASLLIVSVVNGGADRLLLLPSLRFVGKVSYSLYLLHMLPVYLIGVMAADSVSFSANTASALLIVLLTIPASIAVAAVGYWAFERPSISIGRAIAARVSDRRVLAG